MPSSATPPRAAKPRAARLALAHWNDAERAERSRQLERAGFTVETLSADGAGMKSLRADPPDAIVIDLTRLPSHGRAVAMALRQSKGTRRIPLVFVGGAPGKLDRLKHDVPDAVYTEWDDVAPAARRAMSNPPGDPVVPVSRSGPYSGTPLAKKLGIKENAVVALLEAPRGFEHTLEPLPAGVTFRADLRKPADLIVWFVTSRRDLVKRLKAVRAAIGRDGLWISWPKKTSGVESDLTEDVIRDAALPTGIVDFKVCAVDETWSGLKFAVRKPRP